MPTSPTPITSLPTAPSRADPANFATRADSFLGALPTFGTQANSLGTTTYNNAVDSADSATAAGTSAGNAATSASNAAASATAAAGSATAAANSATSAAASYDAFDDRYLGSKASDPSVDNDGNALLTGALYWNTSANEMRVWNGSAWVVSYLPAGAYLQLTGGALSGNLTLSAGTANGVTYLNGSKVLTSGSALTFNGTSLGVVSVASTAALSLSSATSTAINLNIGGNELARLSANVNGIFTVGTEGSVAGLGTGYATLGAYGTNGGGFRIYRGTGAGTPSAVFYADSTSTVLGSAENTSLIFNQNNTERARITSGGNLLVGTTTDPSSNNTRLAVDHTGSDYGLTLNTATSSGPNLLQFRNSNSNGEARLLNNTGGPLTFYRNPTTEAARITSVGDFIPIVQTAAPTLTSNQQMVFTLTSNTNLRISVRGTDGTTRVANITLA